MKMRIYLVLMFFSTFALFIGAEAANASAQSNVRAEADKVTTEDAESAQRTDEALRNASIFSGALVNMTVSIQGFIPTLGQGVSDADMPQLKEDSIGFYICVGSPLFWATAKINDIVVLLRKLSYNDIAVVEKTLDLAQYMHQVIGIFELNPRQEAKRKRCGLPVIEKIEAVQDFSFYQTNGMKDKSFREAWKRVLRTYFDFYNSIIPSGE